MAKPDATIHVKIDPVEIPVLKTYLTAKIHGLRVTAASVAYQGSVTIDKALLRAAGIAIGEQVHVVNLASGDRWVTYALAGETGEFSLNGGGARLGVVGDQCVIMAYGVAATPPGAQVLFIGDEGNFVSGSTRYPAGDAATMRPAGLLS